MGCSWIFMMLMHSHKARVWLTGHTWKVPKVKLLVAQLCQLFTTAWTVAHQAPLAMGFSRQEYWSGWVAIPFCRRSSWPRDWIQVSRIVGRAYNLSHQGRFLDNYKQVIWVLWQWSFICVCSIKEKSKLLSPCLGTKLFQFNLLKRPSFPNTLEWHHGHKSGNQTSRSISGSLISRIYFLYPCANTTILVTVVLISLISSKFIKF